MALDALCPGRFPDHAQTMNDAVAYRAAADAFAQSGPFDPAKFDRANCAQVGLPHVTATEFAGRHYLLYQNGIPLFAGVTWRQVDAEPRLRSYAATGGARDRS